MSNFLDAYTALSNASPRSEVAKLLQSITDGKLPLPPFHPRTRTKPSLIPAPPLTIDDAKRRELIQTILDDLAKPNGHGGKKSRLTNKGAFFASLPVHRRVPTSIKSLLRSDRFATDAAPALQAVKSLGKNPAGSELIATSANLSTLLSLYNAHKDVPEASNEALRCVANAMLLVDQARNTFVDQQVNGGDLAVELLEVRRQIDVDLDTSHRCTHCRSVCSLTL